MLQNEIDKIKTIVRDIVRQEIAKALAEYQPTPQAAPMVYALDINEEDENA